MIRFSVHEPIFVPINGSLAEPGDAAGDISGESKVESSGGGDLSLSLDIALLQQKNTSPSTLKVEPASRAR